MYNRYNKRYTRDYYDNTSSSSDDDDYDTPLAQDMSKTDKQIAELLYNLNHVNDKPQPKINEAARKKRAENLAKAREARKNKLKEKKEKNNNNDDDNTHSSESKEKQSAIKLPGDDDPFKNDKKLNEGSGLRIPPPDAVMPYDNVVMPVYF